MMNRIDPSGNIRASVIIVAFLCLLALGVYYKETHPRQIPQVQVADLDKNPEMYRGKTVLVTGVLTLVREHGTIYIINGHTSLGKEWHFKLVNGSSSIEAVDNTGISYSGLPITTLAGGDHPQTGISVTIRGKLQRSQETGTQPYVFMIESVTQ